MKKRLFAIITLIGVFSFENIQAELMQRGIHSNSLSSQNTDYDSAHESIAIYFKSFEPLSKAEKWKEILVQGCVALESAKKSNRYSDEAKICAQLTSTSFYLGNYDAALSYASRCHQLAEKFEDPTLFIRALYLESAIYRALAADQKIEEARQASFAHAIDLCEKAANIYSKMGVENISLKGKIFFNLGAAHADDPKGDLEKAENSYTIAINCFKKADARDDCIRTTMRLGKVYLLQNNYERCQEMLNEVRPLISTGRLSMHADYLEAQLKFALNDFEKAGQIAQTGLEKAKILGAKEDESRLNSLLQKIENVLIDKM